MRKGLRLFTFVFLFIILTVFSGAAQAASSETRVTKTKTAKKSSKKTVKKPSITVKKADKAPAEVIDVTAEQEKAEPAADKDKVYDLGNIVVRGEDKTKIKDASKKRTAFLTPDSDSGPGDKKETAGFVAGAASGEKAEETSGATKAFSEAEAGSDSTTGAAGMLIYERNSPRDAMRSKSTLGAKGEKSGGYRYKSDYSTLAGSYKYESEKNGDTATFAQFDFGKSERNLPGFDAFSASYTNLQGGDLKLDAKYADPSQRFTLGVKKISNEFKVNASAVDETYDSTTLALGYSKDLTYDRNSVSLPLTLELKFNNDAFDIKTAQSASAVSTQFGLNAEKALSDAAMLQVSPQLYKNGENDAKMGGSVSVVFRDAGVDGEGTKSKYTVTAGRQAKKYDTADFLFSDANSIIWAQDNAGRNRFDGATYENDEKYIQLAAETEVGEKTRLNASYKSAKSDGLLYLTDLNGNDVRQTFASFANGASVSKLNLKASHELDKGLEADAAVETSTVDDGVNDLMPYIPKYEYAFGVNYRHDNGLFARFHYKIKDSMDSSKNPAANPKVDRYSTAGLYLDKNFIDNGKIFFKADNIFNSELKLRPGYSYKARTFAIGVNYIY